MVLLAKPDNDKKVIDVSGYIKRRVKMIISGKTCQPNYLY